MAKGSQLTTRLHRKGHSHQGWDSTHIYLIQEHNLNPKDHKKLERNAKALGMTLVIGFANQNQNGVHYGGTMIISMDAMTTLNKVLW